MDELGVSRVLTETEATEPSADPPFVTPVMRLLAAPPEVPRPARQQWSELRAALAYCLGAPASRLLRSDRKPLKRASGEERIPA